MSWRRWSKKETGIKLTNEARRIYYEAEFKALGDLTRDGLVNMDEFTRLMMLLGYPGGIDGSHSIWKYAGKSTGAKMNQDEYCALMFDTTISDKTNMWRELFAGFDHDGSGWATKAQVISGLEKMGLGDASSLKKIVDKMDNDGDDQVTYTNFLKTQLHQR